MPVAHTATMSTQAGVSPVFAVTSPSGAIALVTDCAHRSTLTSRARHDAAEGRVGVVRSVWSAPTGPATSAYSYDAS